MWTSGDVELEVAIKDGNRAICCSDGSESGVEDGERYGVIADATEGEGEGGSCTLFADDALPLDLSISSRRRCQT